MAIRIENAVIDGTMLGREDHGIMSAFVYVKGSGWGCGFGGFALDSWSEESKRRIGTAYGMEFISSVLDVVGVDTWEALKGKHVRVETEGWGGMILRLGNILEDKWFNPKELAEKMKLDGKRIW